MGTTGGENPQLQQSPVGVAVAKLLLALLAQVLLQGADGLGVVSLKTVDYGGDVLRPLRRVLAIAIKCRFPAHIEVWNVCSRRGIVEGLSLAKVVFWRGIL